MNSLKNLREDRDLTQKQIAKILDCTQTTYSRYETDNLNIPVDALKKLALFFDTSVDYLIGLTDEIKPYKRSNKLDKKN